MSAMPRKFGQAIRRFGTTVTIGGVGVKAVVAAPAMAELETLFPPGEIDGLPRPIRLLYLPHDASAAEGQSCDLGGLTATIRRVAKIRFRDETVACIAVVA